MAACGFIKPDGTACKAIPMTGEPWCYVHHPQQKDKRRRDGAKGGRRGGRGRPASHTKEIVAVKDRIAAVVEDVLAGQLHTSKGNTVAALFNTYLRCIEVELACREQEDLIGRLETLEEQLERNKGSWGYGA